jgi:hypothetical protein
LKFINHELVTVQRYPTAVTRPGASIYDMLRFQAERGDFGPVEDVDRLVRERAALILKTGGDSLRAAHGKRPFRRIQLQATGRRRVAGA